MDELRRVIHRGMAPGRGQAIAPTMDELRRLLPRLPGHVLVAKISRASIWYGCAYDGSTGCLIMAHLSHTYHCDKHFFGTAELYMVGT